MQVHPVILTVLGPLHPPWSWISRHPQKKRQKGTPPARWPDRYDAKKKGVRIIIFFSEQVKLENFKFVNKAQKRYFQRKKHFGELLNIFWL